MFRRGDSDDRHESTNQREARMATDAAGAGSEVTVVGKGARLEGTLVSAGSLRVDGQVKGKITAEGDVTLSPGSQVDADIEAANVRVAGKFKGNVIAKSRAELATGGRVDGNITSKTLVVAEGAMFSGQSHMGGEQGPQSASATPAAQAASGGAPAGETQGAGGMAKPGEPQRAPAR